MAPMRRKAPFRIERKAGDCGGNGTGQSGLHDAKNQMAIPQGKLRQLSCRAVYGLEVSPISTAFSFIMKSSSKGARRQVMQRSSAQRKASAFDTAVECVAPQGQSQSAENKKRPDPRCCTEAEP